MQNTITQILNLVNKGKKPLFSLFFFFLFALQLNAANFFWVAGTGNWNDAANHWATVSGGVPNIANLPTAADNVFFDASSGAAGYTVTLNVAAVANNFTFSGNAFSFIGANSLTVNGISTNSSASAITFGGTNTYNFIGDFTAGATTTTSFTTSQAVSFSNVTVGAGSSFKFAEAPSLATISGTFTPNGTCTGNVIITSSTAVTANVTFTLPQTWNNVNVTSINVTSNNVTVQSGVFTTNIGVTNNAANRTLYWVGNTGNWSDPAHWSLSSNGTGGQCPPTATDDANFDAFSFNIATQSVTMDIDGICKNMNWTGVTNTPRFTGAAGRIFTIAGSLTFVTGMTQTGNAPTYEGRVVFNSTIAQTITMAGRGLGKVSFATAAAGQWTLIDNFLVRNETLLNSGTLITNNKNVSTGTLTVNNAISASRTLDLGSSAVTITQAGTIPFPALDLRGDDNLFVLTSLPASTITLSSANARVNTGTESKTIPNLIFSGGGTKTIETGSAANTITFRNVTVSNGTNFNINGTSPKVYQNITIANNVTGTITGVDTNLGNSITGTVTLGTGGTTTFSGGYAITGNLIAGATKSVIFNGTSNNTFVGAFTLGISSTATFTNVAATNTNSFSSINMNGSSTFKFNAGVTAVSTVSGTINVLGSCATPITLTSNNASQARLDLATALVLYGATVTNINAINQPITVSGGTVANVTNVTGNTVSRNLFWKHSVAGIGSIANWNDPANWSATSGGTTGECPPTIYDNVRFDALSFSAANQIVDMDVNAFCRNMNWTGVTNTPFLQSIGIDTDLTVGGSLIFVPAMTVGTGGTSPTEIRDIYFAATNALTTPFVTAATDNNTIDWGIGNIIGSENTDGKRFRRAFFNQDAAMPLATTATWTLSSAFNLTQDPTNPNGTLKLVKGNLVTADKPIQIRILDANSANGSLDIGNSLITLRATGLTFDFQNDALFNFVLPGATSQFILSSNSTNVIGFTGSVAKEMPTITVPNNSNVILNTDNGTNRITFRNIDLQLNNVVLNITGTSPKTYSTPLSFNNGTNATFTGSSAATPNHNIFTGSVAFGTGVQANFVGENEFQSTFAVGSTVNSTTGIRFTGNGRNQFLGNVALNGSSGFFSLQNTSASPNTFTTVNITNTPLALPPTNPIVWEFSRNSPNTVAGAFTISADCTAPISIRGNGGIANVAFAINQTWNNVIVSNINETGAGTVTVLSTTNAGGNSNITFTVTNRNLYWVGRTGNWSNPANWSISSGGAGGECIPTINDDVFFDVNSFNAAGQTVTVDVDAETRDITWTGATGTPRIVQGATGTNMQIGGDVTLIVAMVWNYNRPVNFRYSDELEADAKNVILSRGQVFKNSVNFDDNVAAINGVWELGDAFATNGALFLTAGIFTTSPASYTLRADNINVNQAGDLTRTINFNSSVTTLTRNNGLVFDARGNTANFSLLSTATSQIRLTGNGSIDIETGIVSKTFPNLFVDVTTQMVQILTSGASRITFRDITWVPVGVSGPSRFRVLGGAPQTYGIININNNVWTEIRGATTGGNLNFYTGTATFGTNSRADIYGNNVWSGAFTVGSTINLPNGFYLRDDNEFLSTVTFTNAGRANVTISELNKTTIFRDAVRFNGVPNILNFNDAASTLEFHNILFIQSTATQQANVTFYARPLFYDDVTFGIAAGGTGVANPVRFMIGANFSTAPLPTPSTVGKKFITGVDSRFNFNGVSVLRDMEIGENNVLTFNDNLTLDNMKLSKFDIVNFPNSDLTTPALNSGRTIINGYLTARNTLCSEWISIRSNLSNVVAEIDFKNDHLVATNTNLAYTFIQDIDNTGGKIVEASPDPIVNISNNFNISFVGSTIGTTYYWVGGSGNWNGLNPNNHWASSTGGPATGCIPTPNDIVIFDKNSFNSSANIVTLDKFFSYCKDMTWEASITFEPRLQGNNAHVLQIYGDLRFPNFPGKPNWNEFQGLTEFKGTTIPTSKTITSNGSRFYGPVEFDSPADTWTIVDDMRVEGLGRANITFNYGTVEAGSNQISLENDWLVDVPTGVLPQALFVAQTSTVNFNGDENATVNVKDFQIGVDCLECSDKSAATSKLRGCSGSPFYNVVVNKNYNKKLELLSTINIYNDFGILVGIVEDDGWQIRGNNIGKVTMQNNTLLSLGSTTSASVFPTCYLPINIDLQYGLPTGFVASNSAPVSGSTQASIVEYLSSTSQMVAGGANFKYATLRLRASEKRFTGEAIINGAFSMTSNVYDMGYQIYGNSYNEVNNVLTSSSSLVLGTRQNVAELTYVATNVPSNVTIPVPVLAGKVTTFPKFTVGNGTFGDGVFSDTKVKLSTTSTVYYNASANQEVAGGITYGNIYLRTSGVVPVLKTITPHNALSAGVITIARNGTVESYNHFIDDGYQITGNGLGTFTGQSNSKLILGNKTSGTNFPSLFVRARIALTASSQETIYNADVPQFMSTEPNYANLTLTAPNSINADLIEKRFKSELPGNFTDAQIKGNLLINPRNHLLDDGNQITGLVGKSVTMKSDLPLGESMLTLGTNGGTDVATEFPLTFGTIVLENLTTVIYNTGSDFTQLVRGLGLNGPVATSSYYNLIIQSNNEATAVKELQAAMQIRNNFTIRQGNTFVENKKQITGSVLATGFMRMEENSNLNIGLNDNVAPKTVFPTNYERGRIVLDNTLPNPSTVRYQSQGTGANIQKISIEPIYSNLVLTSGNVSAGTNVTMQADPTLIVVTPIKELNVTRNLIVDFRVRFEDMGIQIIGNNTNTANNLWVKDGSELVLGTATQVTIFPTLYPRANTNLSHLSTTKSTVIYNAGIVGSTISAEPNYGNVTLTNPAGAATIITKELLGTTDIFGNLLIQTKNNLDVTASNHQINLRGNWECQLIPSATFDSRNGRVVLNGTTQQKITTNAQKFFELEGSSTGGSFQMLDDVTIKTGGKTIFNNGLFIPIGAGDASTVKMIFEENATVGGSGIYAIGGWVVTTSAPQLLADGPSNASHVVGKVEKQGRDAFMFPIGNGVNYAPAGLSARSNAGASYEARYIGPRLPDAQGYFIAQREPLIQVVSHLEYWKIDQLGVADAAFVYLSWDNPRSQASRPEGLLVLRWDGPAYAPTSLWQDKNKGGYTNNAANGVIASLAPISTFSPFTLGSFGNFNLLPLDLLAFDAKIEGESVKVTWKTTNEQDNSHYLVERSQDNTSFSSLGRVNAKGTGLEGTYDYQFWDTEPFKGLSYYRLKMIDADGTFKYSPVRSVLFESTGSGIKGEINLYPNPNGGARFYLTLDGKLTTDAQVEIIDMVGRTVHKQDVQKGSADVIITPLRVLKAGTYILRFVTPQETSTRKFVVE